MTSKDHRSAFHRTNRGAGNSSLTRVLEQVTNLDLTIMKEIHLPTRADQPPYLLLWSSDECMPVVIGFGFGILLKQVFICTVIGIIIAHFYKKFRDLHADGYLMHLLYWYGLGFCRSKSMINPFTKRLIP